MVSPCFSYSVYIMDLKKMYKSFSRLIITVVVLQFYGTLSATF